MNLTWTTSSPEETREMGRRLGAGCRAGDWIGLSGELGAGKTCLVQGLALGLGVDPDYPVTSPTFILHQSYLGRVPLHHLDLYRLESMEELGPLGYQELLEGQGVVVVEWCERIPESSPGRGVLVILTLVDEHTRRLELRGLDARGAELLDGLTSG